MFFFPLVREAARKKNSEFSQQESHDETPRVPFDSLLNWDK